MEAITLEQIKARAIERAQVLQDCDPDGLCDALERLQDALKDSDNYGPESVRLTQFVKRFARDRQFYIMLLSGPAQYAAPVALQKIFDMVHQSLSHIDISPARMTEQINNLLRQLRT